MNRIYHTAEHPHLDLLFRIPVALPFAALNLGYDGDTIHCEHGPLEAICQASGLDMDVLALSPIVPAALIAGWANLLAHHDLPLGTDDPEESFKTVEMMASAAAIAADAYAAASGKRPPIVGVTLMRAPGMPVSPVTLH